MQKKWTITGLLATAAIGLYWQQQKRKEAGLSFCTVEKKMENSGYSVFRTPDKGVYLLLKNHTRSLMIYDNPKDSKKTLFNLLNDHDHGYDHELFIVSDSPNTLFGKTKPLFFRWFRTQELPKKPFIAHFTSLSDFREAKEPNWESHIL